MENAIEQNKHCVFCSEWSNLNLNPLQPFGAKSRIICESRHWYCVPTLGCFTVGYVLLISKRHRTCIATASMEEIEDLLCLEKKISDLYKQIYNSSFICFEHGVVSPEYTGANSIGHAHLHMIPSNHDLWENIMNNGFIRDFFRFNNQGVLYKYVQEKGINTYLTFQNLDGKLFLIPDGSNYDSQFFRKVVAEELNCYTAWNWKKTPCVDNMIRTFNTLTRKQFS